MKLTKIKLAVKVSTHKSTFFKLNESTAWKLSSACVTDEIFCVAEEKKKKLVADKKRVRCMYLNPFDNFTQFVPGITCR